jgi:hypothetical protein
LEFILSFVISFFLAWVLIGFNRPFPKKECGMKETMVKLANEHSNDKNFVKELRNYSHIKIQEGYYEYVEVLDTLSKKEKNDKS